MTTQADPPSEARQLQDARKATENAQALADQLEALVDKQRAELDALRYAMDWDTITSIVQGELSNMGTSAQLEDGRFLRNVLDSSAKSILDQLEQRWQVAANPSSIVERALAVDVWEERARHSERVCKSFMENYGRYQVELKELRSHLAAYRKQYGLLFDAARGVVQKIEQDDNNVTPDTAAAVRALARCVSSNQAETGTAQSEDTQLH